MSGQVINSYSTLEQALQDWLARSDITDTTYAPEIIQMAQLRLYQGYIDNKGEYWPGMRMRQMEKALGPVRRGDPQLQDRRRREAGPGLRAAQGPQAGPDLLRRGRLRRDRPRGQPSRLRPGDPGR